MSSDCAFAETIATNAKIKINFNATIGRDAGARRRHRSGADKRDIRGRSLRSGRGLMLHLDRGTKFLPINLGDAEPREFPRCTLQNHSPRRKMRRSHPSPRYCAATKSPESPPCAPRDDIHPTNERLCASKPPNVPTTRQLSVVRPLFRSEEHTSELQSPY